MPTINPQIEQTIIAQEKAFQDNINKMKAGGVSETSQNYQIHQDKMAIINMKLKAGMITQEEAYTQLAEAERQYATKNADIMKAGGVSQASITEEMRKSNDRYLAYMQEVQRMRDWNQPQNPSNIDFGDKPSLA